MTDYERELVRAVRAGGLGAIRVGGSGSGTVSDRADVVIGIPAHVGGDPLTALLFVEHKTVAHDKYPYVEEEEVTALIDEAVRWNGQAMLGFRWKMTGRSGRVHYLVKPKDAARTPSGKYTCRNPEDAAERATWYIDAALDTPTLDVMGDAGTNTDDQEWDTDPLSEWSGDLAAFDVATAPSGAIASGSNALTMPNTNRNAIPQDRDYMTHLDARSAIVNLPEPTSVEPQWHHEHLTRNVGVYDSHDLMLEANR